MGRKQIKQNKTNLVFVCVFSDGNMKINLESLLPDPESLAKMFQDLQTEEANGMFMLMGIYPEQVFLAIA